MLAFIQEWSPPMGKLEMRRHYAPQHHHHLGSMGWIQLNVSLECPSHHSSSGSIR